MGFNYENEDDDLMEDLQVTLTIDDEEIETKPVTIFEMDERDYIVLVPVDEDGELIDDAEGFLFRYDEDADGEPSISDIEDEEEYARATAYVEELLEAAEAEDDEFA